MNRPVLIRKLGPRDYMETYEYMKTLTMERRENSPDEIWLLEHYPVFTLGLAGRMEHILDPGQTPVIQSDRGGQVTYHGPGQLVCYLLLDLKRGKLPVKSLVRGIEQAVIDMLHSLGLAAERRNGAPGVYVSGSKIASLGVRVRRGCCYHGLALNVDMDTAPFLSIDPCGYPGLTVTQLKECGVSMTVDAAADVLLPLLLVNLGYEPGNISTYSESDDDRPVAADNTVEFEYDD